MIKSPLDTFEEKLPKTQELIQNIIEKLGHPDSHARKIETITWLEAGESLLETRDIFKQLLIYSDFMVSNEVWGVWF